MLMLFLVSGSVFASPVPSSTTENQQKALQIIEQANNKIEAKIEHAVAAADRLQQSYLQDIQAIEENQAANQLSAKLDDLSAKLDQEKNASKKAQIAAEAAAVQDELDQENAILETVKKAEDSEALVVRIYECYNKRSKVRLTSYQPFSEAWECDLLENDLRQLELEEGCLEIELKPYELKTFKFKQLAIW
jgi:Alpha-mannosidase